MTGYKVNIDTGTIERIDIYKETNCYVEIYENDFKFRKKFGKTILYFSDVNKMTAHLMGKRMSKTLNILELKKSRKVIEKMLDNINLQIQTSGRVLNYTP